MTLIAKFRSGSFHFHCLFVYRSTFLWQWPYSWFLYSQNRGVSTVFTFSERGWIVRCWAGVASVLVLISSFFRSNFCISLCHFVPESWMSFLCFSVRLTFALTSLKGQNAVAPLRYTVVMSGVGIHMISLSKGSLFSSNHMFLFIHHFFQILHKHDWNGSCCWRSWSRYRSTW